MKKKMLSGMLVIMIFLTMLGCTNNNLPKDEKILEHVSMIIKSGTLTSTGATIIITDTEDNEEHTYGESFRIDKKEDSKWVTLDPIIDNYGFNDIGYQVDDNNEIKIMFI